MDEEGLKELILRDLYPKRHRADRWLARSAEAKMVCSNCKESGEDCRILTSRIHCSNPSCRHAENICSRRTQELYEHIGKLEPAVLQDVSRSDFDELVNEVYRKDQQILSDLSAEEVADDTSHTRRTRMSDASVVGVPYEPRPTSTKNKQRSLPTVEIPRPPASVQRGGPVAKDIVGGFSQSNSDDASEMNFGVANRASNHGQTQLKIVEKTLEATQDNLKKEKDKNAVLDNANTRLNIEVEELTSENKSLLKRVDTLEKQIDALQADDSKAPAMVDNNDFLKEYMQINLERSKLAQAKEAANGHLGCPLKEAVESHRKVLDDMAAKCFSKMQEGMGDMSGVTVVSSSTGRVKGSQTAKRARLE